MRFVIGMNCFHKGYQLFTFDVPFGFISLLPLVIPGPADTHKRVQILHIIITGQQLYYSNSWVLSEYTPVPQPRSSEQYNFFKPFVLNTELHDFLFGSFLRAAHILGQDIFNLCISPRKAFDAAFLILFQPFLESGVGYANFFTKVIKLYCLVALVLLDQEFFFQWI